LLCPVAKGDSVFSLSAMDCEGLMVLDTVGFAASGEWFPTTGFRLGCAEGCLSGCLLGCMLGRQVGRCTGEDEGKDMG
jgi:hypothetical protein